VGAISVAHGEIWQIVLGCSKNSVRMGNSS
jgi:hypothetical protein